MYSIDGNMYNNPDDRISSDEDILIKKEDYEKVKEERKSANSKDP